MQICYSIFPGTIDSPIIPANPDVESKRRFGYNARPVYPATAK
jgi:hypothetical protein